MNVAPIRQNPGTRILIANEDPLEAMSLERLVRIANNCETRITTDLREVVPLYRCWPFEMLFLDMHSPRVDALQVIDELGYAVRGARLTLVSLVNKGSEQTRLASLACGAITTIAKPINHAEAYPHIDRAFNMMPMRVSSF